MSVEVTSQLQLFLVLKWSLMCLKSITYWPSRGQHSCKNIPASE